MKQPNAAVKTLGALTLAVAGVWAYQEFSANANKQIKKPATATNVERTHDTAQTNQSEDSAETAAETAATRGSPPPNQQRNGEVQGRDRSIPSRNSKRSASDRGVDGDSAKAEPVTLPANEALTLKFNGFTTNSGIFQSGDRPELRVQIDGVDIGPPTDENLARLSQRVFELTGERHTVEQLRVMADQMAARTRPIRPEPWPTPERPEPQIVRLNDQQCVVVAPNAVGYRDGAISRSIGAPFPCSACYCRCQPQTCSGEQSLIVEYGDGTLESIPRRIP